MDDNIFGPVTNSQIVSMDYLPSTQIDTSDINYLYPRQIGTGSTRGTQTIGVGSINLDGSDNQITIGDTALGGSSTAGLTIGSQGSSSTQAGVAATSIASNPQGFGFSVTDTTGTTLLLGILADGTLGMSITDPSGFELFKLNGSTWFWYDKNFNVNVMQIGELPDGTYGEAVAKQGLNVSSIYT
jgi:hypothetical protein